MFNIVGEAKESSSNNQEGHVKIEVTSEGGKIHNETAAAAAAGGETSEKEKSDKDKEDGGASAAGNSGNSHSSSKSHRSSHKKRKNKSRHRSVESKGHFIWSDLQECILGRIWRLSASQTRYSDTSHWQYL